MMHLDLFSGIGGFALAVDEVWPGSEHIFCDNDPFVRQVLKQHWPESEVYDDIRDITDTECSGLQERPKEDEARLPSAERGYRVPHIDILTGGFPCQPFSAAGLRRGTDDDRHLWPEMLRVIRLTKPTWVIAENVRGLLTLQGGVVFEQVCTDLEASGYEVQPFIIPAVALGAPHRRDRVWFVAHAIDRGQGAEEPGGSRPPSGLSEEHRPEDGTARQSKRTAGRRSHHRPTQDTRSQRGRGRRDGHSPWHDRQVQDARPSDARSRWEEPWLEVAARLCSVDDGLPAEVGDFTLTKAGHRREQLKAYGNAIVPQVAVEIMRGMAL